MDKKIYTIAFTWGTIWSSFLQWTHFGQFLAQKRTWLAVVIGVGVDLLLILPLIPRRLWVKIFTVIAVSSLPIILRSLANEWDELMETIRGIEQSR